VRGVLDSIRAIVEKRDVLTPPPAHENRAGDLRGSLDWRNATDGSLQLEGEPNGWRRLAVVERRDGSDVSDVSCRFRLIPQTRGGSRLTLELAPTAPERPGPLAADVIAQRLLELFEWEPGISARRAVFKIGEKGDSRASRRGWELGRGTYGSDPDRVVHRENRNRPDRFTA
jgi:hypothetical protein